MVDSNELSSEGSNEVIPPRDFAAADEFSEEDSNDIIDVADDLIQEEEEEEEPVIIVLITVEKSMEGEKKEEDPIPELSVESLKNYAAATEQNDHLDPILVIPLKKRKIRIQYLKEKDNEEEEEAKSVKDPNLESVKDPNLGISEKHSKEEKKEEGKENGKQIVEEKEKEDDDEAPANEGDDDDDQKRPIEIAVSAAVSTAEMNGKTVKILRYHGVNGVTKVMEEFFNLSEITFFVIEEFFANTMLQYVKNSVQMRGIPCVIHSENFKFYRYIWSDGSMGSTAYRAREPEEADIINELVNGNLAVKFAKMRRKLRKQSLPPDAESVDKV